VKDFFLHYVSRRLSVPFLIVICLLPAAAGTAQASKNAPVEVGFVGTPPPGFQNVLLNVQAVRINSNAKAGPGSGRWETIPTPPGIGGKDQFAELQIDLNASQNIPQLFNTADVRPDTYRVAEILLDRSNPGFLIPTCPQTPPVGVRADGCIDYPITLNNGNVITVVSSGSGGLVAPSNGKLGQLLLQVNMVINQAPTTFGGAYLVSVTISTVPNSTAPNSALGIVTGSVTVKTAPGSTSTSGKVRKLAVTAEAIGTNTPVATAPVKNGQYTLFLPAAGGPAPPGFGTQYDLAVAGGDDTYAAERLLPVYPGQTVSNSPNFTVNGNQTLGDITGQVTDSCTGKAIVGATLQLLIPPNSNNTANCLQNPEQCVAVASAYTDNAGDFPLPGTVTIPAAFDNVPTLPKGGAYVMEVTAPGYDNLVIQATPSSSTGKKNGGKCTLSNTSTDFVMCNLAMTTGYLTGSVPIIPPNPGQSTLVQVLAEDTGTNTIEGALPMPVNVMSSAPGSFTFTLNVPTTPFPGDSVRTFDLIATTIDQYQGKSDPYPGHTVAVLSGVTGPQPPTGPSACSTATATFPDDQEIDCVGHGSITGVVSNPNLGTSVVLSKDNVQLMSSIVQNQLPNPSASSNYSFCVPADTYQVQREQLPTPDPDVTPTAMPTSSPDGDAMTVTIPAAPVFNGPAPTPSATPTGGPTPTATATGGPTPTATATPNVTCPTTCTKSDGSCPATCNNTIAPQL
jgi:hypothetical protein